MWYNSYRRVLMYKTKEEALDALKTGKSNIRSLQSQICKLRKKKDIDKLMQFTYAIEHYRMFDLGE